MSGRNISKNTKLQDITNYTIWMYKLRTLLQGECLWNVVNPFNVPTVESSSINSLHLQQTTKDTMQGLPSSTSIPSSMLVEQHKATIIIVSMTKDSILLHIMHTIDFRKNWIKLRDLYQSNSMNWILFYLNSNIK